MSDDPGYDWGEGRRRWRALDLGTSFAYLEAEAPRVSCTEHGVVVAAVPWARHDSSFTRSFEDQVAWLTVHTSKTAVSELMRIAWRSVGWICQRVAAEAQAQRDLLSGLERIGFDEIAIRKGRIPHGRGRPRHRQAGVGAPGSRPQNDREVPRSPRRRALQADQADLLR